MVDDIDDPRRQEPAFTLGEREMLESWLEFHRTTMLFKWEGHMAEVERSWFRCVLLCEPEAPSLWYDPAVEDSELVPLDDADWSSDLAAWNAECAASRAAASARSLDDTGLRFGESCSLRWIYVHMIEEYARHNGHADLIRELIDESVGC